ncbi:hypothetical protein VQ643_08665 [Pseudomonas sp. F1_0610]|uniref:hypothetical protein n=1 Tax=Pseudomonas sp. F1_0610 TaxID=3114284 RepID=UPI0039C168E9
MSRDWLEMLDHLMASYRNGGKLDAFELTKIIDIAKRDGQLDANEIRVLQKIILSIKPDEVDAEMRLQLERIKDKIDKQNKLNS